MENLMNNILEMRREMIQVFDGVKSKRLPLEIAKELNNTAGKILSTIKIRLVYATLRKEKPNDPFLNIVDKGTKK